MHDPDHVMDQVRVRYHKNWRDGLLDRANTQFSFPLAAPSAQAIARESDAVGGWVRVWRNWSLAHPRAPLRSVTRATVGGAQDIFPPLPPPAVDAVVPLDGGLARHWRQANASWSRIRTLPGGVVEEQLRPFLHPIVELGDGDFKSVLQSP